jgi:hypothetical protein
VARELSNVISVDDNYCAIPLPSNEITVQKKGVKRVQKKQFHINTGCDTNGVDVKNSDILIDIELFSSLINLEFNVHPVSSLLDLSVGALNVIKLKKKKSPDICPADSPPSDTSLPFNPSAPLCRIKKPLDLVDGFSRFVSDDIDF